MKCSRCSADLDYGQPLFFGLPSNICGKCHKEIEFARNEFGNNILEDWWENIATSHSPEYCLDCKAELEDYHYIPESYRKICPSCHTKRRRLSFLQSIDLWEHSLRRANDTIKYKFNRNITRK